MTTEISLKTKQDFPKHNWVVMFKRKIIRIINNCVDDDNVRQGILSLVSPENLPLILTQCCVILKKNCIIEQNILDNLIKLNEIGFSQGNVLQLLFRTFVWMNVIVFNSNHFRVLFGTSQLPKVLILKSVCNLSENYSLSGDNDLVPINFE